MAAGRWSETVYFMGMGTVSALAGVWLAKTLIRDFCRHLAAAVRDPESEVSIRLIIFLIVKAIFIVIHVSMMILGWSGVRVQGRFVGMGILAVDLLQALAGFCLWHRFKHLQDKISVETQKAETERRRTYLEELPRWTWSDLRTDTTAQDCIICLSDFSPSCVVLKLDCGHVFHESCIGTWLVKEKSSPCPFRCRDFLKDSARDSEMSHVVGRRMDV